MARLLLTVVIFTVITLQSSPAAAQFWPGGAGSGPRSLLASAPTAGDDAERVLSTNPIVFAGADTFVLPTIRIINVGIGF